MTKMIIVQTTINSEEKAKLLAKNIIEHNLGKCIHIASIKSMYTWKHTIEYEEEWVLQIKCKQNTFIKLAEKIEEWHPYEVPEIIAIPINQISKSYKDYLES